MRLKNSYHLNFIIDTTFHVHRHADNPSEIYRYLGKLYEITYTQKDFDKVTLKNHYHRLSLFFSQRKYQNEKQAQQEEGKGVNYFESGSTKEKATDIFWGQFAQG